MMCHTAIAMTATIALLHARADVSGFLITFFPTSLTRVGGGISLSPDRAVGWRA